MFFGSFAPANPSASSEFSARRGGGGLANDKLRLDVDAFRIGSILGPGNAVKEGACGKLAHLTQGLANGGEAGMLEGGALNVVESDHGNVFGHAETGFAKGADGADSGDVIEGEERGEQLAGRKQLAGDFIAERRRSAIVGKLGGASVVKGKPETIGCFENGAPAGLGVGTEILALDEGDFAMAELGQMVESHPRGAGMVESDVGDALARLMAGDGNNGNGKRAFAASVDGDDALDGALQEHFRVFVDQIGAMAMAREKIEVAFLKEKILDAAHDQSGIALADLGNDDADGEAALAAQGTGEEIGAIVKTLGLSQNAGTRFLRDGSCRGRAIDDERNGGRREAQTLRQILQAHMFVARRRV